MTFEACGDLPQSVMADEMRLRQVLLNLLGNAVKFTDRGAISLSVTVVYRHGTSVCLAFEVRDTGVGMTAQELDGIFRPFEQVGDSRCRMEGTGLGLVISRQIVQRMGGDIHGTSEPGRGTRFCFELEFPTLD